MQTRFVCLANSFKEGGRCLAGIELDNNNNPKLENGHPIWIRPICKTPHGEVPNHFTVHLHVLDIIEIDVTGYPEKKDYQSENVFFNENSIKVIGRFDFNTLPQLCDNRTLVFGNKGKAVSEEKIGSLTHSLVLIQTNQFEVIEKTYEDTPNKHQLRLVFSYNGIRYDFPVTDPVFLHNYQRNPDILEGCEELLLCLSLGVAWQNWYYKLVAAIIFQ